MRKVTPFIILLLAVAAVYRKVLFGGDVFFFADIATQNYPWKAFLAEHLRAGALPVWFPFMHSGFPLYAEIQAGTFYPLNWIFFSLLPAPVAYHSLQALHLFLCGAFLFLYAREWEQDRGPALFAALVFILSGFFFTHLVHLSMYLTACWLPLELLLLEKALKKDARFWFLMLCPVVALQILAGHPQIVAFSALALFFRLAWHVAVEFPRQGARPCLRWLALGTGTAVLALALSAVQILPTLELVKHSIRSGGLIQAVANEHSMAPWTLLMYVFPNVFGYATPDLNVDFWLPGVNYWEICPYAGLLPLILCLLPLRRKPVGPYAFFFFLLLFSLVMMLGTYTPLYGLLKKVPPFFYFRAPCRFILLATLALALLSGRGLHILVNAGESTRDRALKLLTWASGLAAAAVLAVSVAGTLALTVFGGPIRQRLMGYGSRFIREQVHEQGTFLKPLEYYEGKLSWAVDTILNRLQGALDPFLPGVYIPFLLMLLFFLLVVLYRKRVFSNRAFLAGCIILLVLDLSIFGLNYNPSMPREEALAPSPVVEQLKTDPDRFRIMRDVRSTAQGSREEKSLLPACVGSVWGIRSSDQFTPLALGRYVDLLQIIQGDPGYILEGEIGHRNLMQLLGTRYILSKKPVRDLPLTARHEGEGVFTYRNPGELPLLFFAADYRVEPDRERELGLMTDPERDFSRTVLLEKKPPYDLPVPREEARIRVRSVSQDEDRVEADVTAPTPGMLVLTVCHYPGWTVRVDGEPRPLFRADYTYQGVFLEPGHHTVSFRFDPPGLRTGTVLTLVSLALWALLAGLLVRRKPLRCRESEPLGSGSP